MSQLEERLWEVYQAFAQRDLSEYEITYLFVDGIPERLRPGAKREPVLAAWGFTIEGRRVLIHMMAGSKEDAETATAFFEDMKRCTLTDPLLDLGWRSGYYQGDRDLLSACGAAAVPGPSHAQLGGKGRLPERLQPDDVWPDFKVRAQAVYQAPSRADPWHYEPLDFDGCIPTLSSTMATMVTNLF